MKVSLSLLVLNVIDNQLCVLVQKRLNTKEAGWVNTWEVPQGKIADDRSFYSIARDELKDEAGLDLQTLFLSHESNGLFNLSGSTTSLDPFFLVNISTPYNHQAVHILALTKGIPHDTEEATDHRWVPLSNLRSLLTTESICPLNRGALEKLSVTPERELYQILDNKRVPVCKVISNSPAIACDIGGVLILWNDNELFPILSEIFGCSIKEITDLISGNLRHELHLGKITHKFLWENLCANLPNQPHYRDFLDIWEDNVKIIDENVAIIKRLRERHPSLRFVATTNIDSVTEEILFEKYEWSSIFDHWFSSWRLGASKPKENFFQIITNDLQVGNKYIFLIDDHEKNIKSANNYGWATFCNDPNSIFNEKMLNEAVTKWLMEIQK